MLEKESSKDPEKLTEEFRRCLKERALNHSQFYRRLSTTSQIFNLKAAQSTHQSAVNLNKNCSTTLHHHHHHHHYHCNCENDHHYCWNLKKDCENNNHNSNESNCQELPHLLHLNIKEETTNQNNQNNNVGDMNYDCDNKMTFKNNDDNNNKPSTSTAASVTDDAEGGGKGGGSGGDCIHDNSLNNDKNGNNKIDGIIKMSKNVYIKTNNDNEVIRNQWIENEKVDQLHNFACVNIKSNNNKSAAAIDKILENQDDDSKEEDTFCDNKRSTNEIDHADRDSKLIQSTPSMLIEKSEMIQISAATTAADQCNNETQHDDHHRHDTRDRMNEIENDATLITETTTTTCTVMKIDKDEKEINASSNYDNNSEKIVDDKRRNIITSNRLIESECRATHIDNEIEIKQDDENIENSKTKESSINVDVPITSGDSCMGGIGAISNSNNKNENNSINLKENTNGAIDDDDGDVVIHDNRQRRQQIQRHDNNDIKIESFETVVSNNSMLASTSTMNNNIVEKNYNTCTSVKCDHKYYHENDDIHHQQCCRSVRESLMMINNNNNNSDNNNHNGNNDENKIKMNKGEEWNGSNYFTFPPATSFDDDRLDRTARWCRSRDNSTLNKKNGDISIDTKLNNFNNNTIRKNNKKEIAEKKRHFERYLEDTKRILSESKNLNKEDDCVDKYYGLYYNNYCDKLKDKDSNKDNSNREEEKKKKTEQDSIREEIKIEDKFTFPCVEKLIKMYTKLLQDKKNEEKLLEVNKNEQTEKDTNVKGNELQQEDEQDANGNRKKVDSKSTITTTTVTDRTDLNRNSPISDEGCPVGQSPYSSDCDDAEPVITSSECDVDNVEIENIQIKDKVIRSSSSDSALGLDDEGVDRPASPPPPSVTTGRRMTLTVTDIPLRPSLLPVAEPTNLPDSPTNLDKNSSSSLGNILTQQAVPSKVLLEERVVEIPEDRFGSLSSSRRESAQSCLSDYNSEYGGVRYVRTPSVVVSDYSDDVMCGITLEEIEYFRAHRMRRRSSADTAATEKDDSASDVSAASSCSNLYYCGSTISALDGADCYVNGMRIPIIERKVSDCSTCSTGSGGDDDDEHYFTSPPDFPSQHHNRHHHLNEDQKQQKDEQQKEQQEEPQQQQQQNNRKHKKVGDQILN